MGVLVRLAVKYPEKTLFFIAFLTVLLGAGAYLNFSIETNPAKSFSRNLDVVKFHNITARKFKTRDYILIGVEERKSGVFSVPVLRYVEGLVGRLQNLKLDKKVLNSADGKYIDISIPAAIDPGGILSYVNADDVTVDRETGTVVTGTLTERAERAAGIARKSEALLPSEDESLKKIIPELKSLILESAIYSGTLVSPDSSACAVMVPVESKTDGKLRVIRREIFTLIDPLFLKDSFESRGMPHLTAKEGIDFNAKASSNNEALSVFFRELFADLGAGRGFEEAAGRAEGSLFIERMLSLLENDEAFRNDNVNISYDDAVDRLYEFVVSRMDRAGLERLEASVYSIKDITDTGVLYDSLISIADEGRPEGVKVYVAGRLAAEALIERFVLNDMSLFLGLTSIIIILVLYLSFRSKRGVLLPLSTVLISAVWIFGAMLSLGIKISSGTIALPTILIAVGSAYVIHFLSRYYDEARAGKSRKDDAVFAAYQKVNIPLNLSAVTTISAFLSIIASAGVIDVRNLGILTAAGVAVNLFLTYTFVPALLSIMPLPPVQLKDNEDLVTRWMERAAGFTIKHPGGVFLAGIVLSLAAVPGIFALRTESSVTYFFKEDNPIRVSSSFIDKHLTGTGEISAVFSLRDRVCLKSSDSRRRLASLIDGYHGAFEKLANGRISSNQRELYNYFASGISGMKVDLLEFQDELERRIGIMRDILNEGYSPASRDSAEKRVTAIKGIADISELAENASYDNSTAGAVDSGVLDIEKRIGKEAAGADTAGFVREIRKTSESPVGKAFRREFFRLSDYMTAGITQPEVLRKLDRLTSELKALETPAADIDGTKVKPVGKILSISDLVKMIYRVFYHDDNPDYDKIPDVRKDNLADETLTDRQAAAVCLSQLRGSQPDTYGSLVSGDGSMIQYMVYVRSDRAGFLSSFSREFYRLAGNLFPVDDPYVEKAVLSGLPAINMTMNKLLFDQQFQSVLITMAIVFLCCVFIFMSFAGGLFSIIPIGITLAVNMGLMGWLEFPINYSTVIIASIAVGTGIDYTIHFIDRFKYEHISNSRPAGDAYLTTVRTIGRSIMTNALSMAGGFSVMAFSEFKMLSVSGLMISLAMLISSTAAITVLPAIIIWMKPSFVARARSGEIMSEGVNSKEMR